MRRALLVVALLAAVSALQAQVYRPRISSVAQTPAACRPNVNISTPTAEATLTTAEATIELTGTSGPGACGAAVTAVSWVNSAGGSGDATGILSWTIQAVSGSLESFNDLFSGSVTQDVVLHTPNIGLSWSAWFSSSPGNYCRLLSADQSVGAGLTDATAGHTFGCYATPTQALSGLSYDLNWAWSSLSGGTNGWAVLFGGDVTGANVCAVYGVSAAGNPDVFITETTAGVPVTKTSGNLGPGSTQAWSMERRGAAVAVKLNGSTVLSTTVACTGSYLGLGFGDFRGSTATIGTAHRFTSFQVIDQGVSTSAIPLSLGSNVLTVTARDADGNTNTDVLTVTRTGGVDTTNPSITIQSPTSSGAWSDSVASQTLSGVASDDVAVDHVTYSCTGATTVSGTATGATSWSQALTLANGMTTCSVIAYDPTGNASTPAVLVFTITLTDMVNPVVVISTAGGASAVTPVTIAGTVTDNVVVTGCTWTNSLGGSGAVTGTFPSASTAWSASVPLSNGSNVLLVTCQDSAGNPGTATVTFTYATPLSITSPTVLPNAVTGSNYSATGTTISATGGTSPYTFTNNGAGTSLNDGDADCAGLSIATSGLISGTPGGSAGTTCSWTSKVTDNVAGTATHAHTIAIVAAGTGPNGYWSSVILASPNLVKGLSMRPVAGHPCLSTLIAWCGDANYSSQLALKIAGSSTTGGYTASSDVILGVAVTYSPMTDTNPHAQDAAKIIIPPFAFVSKDTPGLASGLNTSDTVVLLTGGAGTNTELNVAGLQVLIDNEIVQLATPACSGAGATNCAFNATTRTMTIAATGRGHNGTPAASHLAGAKPRVATNNIPNALFFPVNTVDGTTTLYTWDAFWTDSYVNTGLGGHKYIHIRKGTGTSGNVWNQINADFTGVSCATPPGFNGVTTLGYTSQRWLIGTTGVNNSGAPPLWTDTNGELAGPNVTSVDARVCPVTGTFTLVQNRWTRFWLRIQQVANDYDLVDFWAADTETNPVHLSTGLQNSVGKNPGVQNQAYVNVEFNSSATALFRNANCVPALYAANPTTYEGCTLVHYMKNVAVLSAAGLAPAGGLSDANMTSTYLVKPIP